jgi:multicomponent Na+:H+ antiporter subunit B
MRNFFVLIIVAVFAYAMYGLYESFDGNQELSKVARYYAEPQNVEKVNAQNLVTAVVVTYRGLDTLGEVTVLFLTAATIAFFLKKKSDVRTLRINSEIFKTAATVLYPIILMLGIYIFINGHLTPGGGFQGGAVMASAVILMMLAFPNKPINRSILEYIESTSGVMFVLLAALGAAIGTGFLDNTILPMGTFGKLFSAGAIPVIYSFVGLKVGAELANIITKYKAAQTDVQQ